MFTLVSFRITPIVSNILGRTQNVKYSLPSFNKLYVEYKHPIRLKKKIIKKFSYNKNLTIKLKNFKNENSQVTILKDISINIPKGSKVGIIGPSGSGKSTIIDIICGFKKAKKNSIKVDGKCVLDNIEDWQQILATFLKIWLCNQSIKENILFGFSNSIFK